MNNFYFPKNIVKKPRIAKKNRGKNPRGADTDGEGSGIAVFSLFFSCSGAEFVSSVGECFKTGDD